MVTGFMVQTLKTGFIESMLNYDPTETNGGFPVHFSEVRTASQFEEQHNPCGVLLT